MDHLSTADETPHNQVLLTIKVTGPQQQTKLETELPARPEFVGNFLDKTEQDIERRFVLESDAYLGMNRNKFSTPTYYRYYQLNWICIVTAKVEDVFKNIVIE